MAILYVAAEAAELRPFANLLGNVRKLKWPLDYAYEGILDGRRVMLVANGAGPKLAAQAVEVAIRAVPAAGLSSSELEAVVSTGFCGALDPNLPILQVVLGTKSISANKDERSDCAAIHSAPEGFAMGIIISQDRIANSTAEKHTLALTGAIAVDMEAFGVATRTKGAGLPFYCIKVVTDHADESFGFDLNKMRATTGRLARGKIVRYALTHPRLLPELWRLKQRSGSAAKVLGEFLVSCRIKPESDGTLVE